MKRARQISLKECYSILNLSKGATLDDVKRAYRRRAFELHPDLNPGNAEAARQFQQLNEAYVALSQVLHDENPVEPPKEEAPPRENTASREQPQAEASGPEQTQSAAADSANAAGAQGTADGGDKRQKAASAAYAQEDVLRDLLNDPFARRVFEDIYSEVSRQAGDAPPAAPPSEPAPQEPPKPKPRKVQMEWGKHKFNLDFTHGVKGVLKGWLQQQIDEQQTFKLPGHSLVPGARIRLQIRRGLSEDLSSIEITLPQDFVVGKPVRLRGLGKKVGPWQGDLYLTLEAR